MHHYRYVRHRTVFFSAYKYHKLWGTITLTFPTPVIGGCVLSPSPRLPGLAAHADHRRYGRLCNWYYRPCSYYSSVRSLWWIPAAEAGVVNLTSSSGEVTWRVTSRLTRSTIISRQSILESELSWVSVTVHRCCISSPPIQQTNSSATLRLV